MVNNISNSAALQGLYGANKTDTAGSIGKIASDNAIQSAGDNVAALSIATQLAGDLSGYRAQQGNVALAQSSLQVADGGFEQIQNILQRQTELAVQASNGALPDSARSQLNQEFQALSQEIDRIAGATSFNGQGLIDGSAGASVQLAQSDATAAAFSGATNSAGSADSSAAIQAFNANDGSTYDGEFPTAYQENKTPRDQTLCPA